MWRNIDVPQTREWNKSTTPLLTFLDVENGCRRCLSNWHASHMPMLSLSVKFGSLMTTPFDCMFWSFWLLMWPILLCHVSSRFGVWGLLQTWPTSPRLTWGQTFDLLVDCEPQVGRLFQRSTLHSWTALACHVLLFGRMRADFSWWLGHARRSWGRFVCYHSQMGYLTCWMTWVVTSPVSTLLSRSGSLKS